MSGAYAIASSHTKFPPFWIDLKESNILPDERGTINIRNTRFTNAQSVERVLKTQLRVERTALRGTNIYYYIVKRLPNGNGWRVMDRISENEQEDYIASKLIRRKLGAFNHGNTMSAFPTAMTYLLERMHIVAKRNGIDIDAIDKDTVVVEFPDDVAKVLQRKWMSALGISEVFLEPENPLQDMVDEKWRAIRKQYELRIPT